MNGYIGFYRAKRVEVYADTLCAARDKIATQLKVKKPWEITVMLAEKDGKPVIHDGAELNGGGGR